MRLGVKDVFGVKLSPDFDRLAAELDPWSGMPSFKGSVQIIQGDSDPVVPMEICEKAASLFCDAALSIIPNAGHGFLGSDLSFAIDASVRFVLEHAV